jgi:uncharacterized protein
VRYWLIIIVCLGILGASGWYLYTYKNVTNLETPVGQAIEKITEKPLDKYTIENLSKRTFEGSQIILGEQLEETKDYTVHKFSFMSDGKKVTGLAHIPIRNSLSPVIVQLRGYVEQSVYQSGIGTKRSAEVFAKNGFISLAPDGLGYGESDNPSEDIFEERFQTYTTVLNLLASIKTLPMIDSSKVGIWGHSNGGQQALTILEISGKTYPTTLWAPVTKVFPYSILYFTDEADDKGKALRKKLAEFEANYNVDSYTLTNYLDRINAPIQLHQGTADDAVPTKWSNEFVESMKNKEKDITYYIYPNADHNLAPSWDTVVQRDIEFFRKQFAGQ